MTRETIYAALAARLSSTLTDYYVTRDLLPVAQCQTWPAAVVTTGNQVAMSDDGDTVTLWHLEAIISLYLRRSDTSTPFETSINAAIDLVVAALAAQPDESAFGATPYTTLGDSVEWAKVRGAIQVFREPGDGQAVIQIPVEMLAC